MKYNRFYITLISFMLLLGITASAQSTSLLKVKVVEQDSNEPVPGAIIRNNKSIYSTNDHGICSVPYNNSGKITLSVSSIGFKEIKAKTFSVKGSMLIIPLLSADNE